jgi:hypothetical protein
MGTDPAKDLLIADFRELDNPNLMMWVVFFVKKIKKNLIKSLKY